MAHEVFLVAHELAHPLLERAKHASGALEGVQFPSVTGGEVARSLARIALDEYRADRLADLVLSKMVSAVIDGDSRPLRSWDYIAEFQRTAALHNAVHDLYPWWPDTVQGTGRDAWICTL